MTLLPIFVRALGNENTEAFQPQIRINRKST